MKQKGAEQKGSRRIRFDAQAHAVVWPDNGLAGRVQRKSPRIGPTAKPDSARQLPVPGLRSRTSRFVRFAATTVPHCGKIAPCHPSLSLLPPCLSRRTIANAALEDYVFSMTRTRGDETMPPPSQCSPEHRAVIEASFYSDSSTQEEAWTFTRSCLACRPARHPARSAVACTLSTRHCHENRLPTRFVSHEEVHTCLPLSRPRSLLTLP